MMNEENDIDEWIFNSFKKYHKLQMFGIDKSIISMELSSSSSICLACNKKENIGFEILDLELPNKLFQLENEPDSLNTSRDLKMKCGTLTKNSLIDMKTLFNKNKIILSEKGIKNVSLYQVNTNNSDQMCPLLSFDSKIDGGKLAVHQLNNSLVIWGKENVKQCGHIFDIEKNKCMQTLGDEDNDLISSYLPQFTSNNELLVLNSDTGSFTLYNLIDGQKISTVSQQENNSHKWIASSIPNTFKNNSINNNITMVSNGGELLMYDLRFLKIPKVHKKNVFPKCSNKLGISMDPNNFKNYAISGFDENIYIYEELNNEDFKLKFKHEGHLYTENDNSSYNNVTSGAVWLPMCGNNTLISSANDGSIQGWQYIS
ncbi:uncharacterized protein LOC126904080 [Daktulosphaira vitifoliae]|uniref:uncharacterized protein LOC126904080 n=1 Tax=Daktulosphaira vitifoliae TaxID=58002 RepID=UPI0021AAF2AE|nr:uncharacterized protein LOC126904080 [Daktulosphaira vitifoliae]